MFSNSGLRISEIGEKRLISEFVRPFFNAEDDPSGVGDDCAMLDPTEKDVFLFSTDRVPADLIAFRLGILDYEGLGKYLAYLNISDIAACGGRPVGLLLNLGLPRDFLYEDFKLLCSGVKKAADRYSCRVLGGDISDGKELSISATSIGIAKPGRVLTRRGARPGDSIFISRPLGLTPTAFAYYLSQSNERVNLSPSEIQGLNEQFTNIDPLISLGLALASSGECTSCMDNTDGVGQSLLELSAASQSNFIVDRTFLQVPAIVEKVAQAMGKDVIEMAFSAGADFSLVGTLRGRWSQTEAVNRFGSALQIIGYVDIGKGVTLDSEYKRTPLTFSGWNYFL
jgi:thiamine-monophosphate kinase